MALTAGTEQLATAPLPAEAGEPAEHRPAEADAAPSPDERPADAAAESAGDGGGNGRGDVPGAGTAVTEAPSGDVAVETVGGDEIEEVEPRRPRINRSYK